jgi:hypothetical protein
MHHGLLDDVPSFNPSELGERPGDIRARQGSSVECKDHLRSGSNPGDEELSLFSLDGGLDCELFEPFGAPAFFAEV